MKDSEKKDYFSLERRVQNLIDKNIIQKEKIESDKELLKEVTSYLKTINYFKLKPYIKDYQKRVKSYDINSFNEIINMFKFDRELRGLIIKLTEIVEISMKTFIIDFLCKKGSYLSIIDLLEIKNFKKKPSDKEKESFEKTKKDLIKKINSINYKAKKELKRYKENPQCNTYDFTYEELNEIKDYIDLEYDKLPIWIIIEELSFGDITTILKYTSIKNKKEIFKEIGGIDYSPKKIGSALNGIRYLRNLCSHNSKIINRTLKYSMPASNVKELDNEIGLIRYLMFIKLFVKKYDEESWLFFCLELDELIRSNDLINLKDLNIKEGYIDKFLLD